MDAAILTEDFAGLRNQALGLAERAGLTPLPRSLAARGLWSHLPARSWPDPLRVVAPACDPPLPRLVIGCGGMAAPVGARLRRLGHQVVHVQHPRIAAHRFDLVVVQSHDRLTGGNVVVTRTALHRVTPERLAEARLAWAPAFAALPRPLVCALIGGSNGRFRLDRADAAILAAQLAAMMRGDRVGLALTPSRRTAPAAMAELRGALAPLGAWIWDGSGDNPYLGLLACADLLIVTGDSVSMISEAAATAVPISIAALPGRSRRIAAFTAGLVADGRVRPFGGRYDPWPCQAIDDTDHAAATLRARLG